MHASPATPDFPTPPTPSSGTDRVVYQERLRPSVGIWIIAALLSSLAILVFVPIGIEAGIIAAVVMFAVLAVILVATTPTLRVTEQSVHVGRAGIERHFVGAVTGYRGDDATHQRGPALHGLAFLCIRGWIDPVVRIQIEDDRDRTPYWLTSTRDPEALVAALGGRMARDVPDDDEGGQPSQSVQ